MMRAMRNDTLRKLYSFVCICLFALAALGGVAYLFFDHHAIFGISAIATSAMAVPYLIECINDLMS